MDRCERCGKVLDTKRWLFREEPARKVGIDYLLRGCEVERFSYRVCRECSLAFEKFMAGEEVAAADKEVG